VEPVTTSRDDREAAGSRLERTARRLRSVVGRASAGDRSRPGVPLDRSTGRVSVVLATILSLQIVVLLPGQIGRIFGLPGALLIAGGAITGSRRSIGYGFAAVSLGLVFAGVQGATPLALVLCAFCATLAWDVGRYGITVGEQLGRAGATARIELAHALASATVGLAGVAVGYAAFLLGPADQPVPAVALVLLGTVVVLTVIRT